jgi:hypothetical protein
VRKFKTTEQQRTKRVNLNIPIQLHNSFKAATASQGVSMTDTLMAFIQQYVCEHGQAAKQPKGRRQ